MTLNCYAEVFKQGIVHPESLKDMDWKDSGFCTLAANCQIGSVWCGQCCADFFCIAVVLLSGFQKPAIH